MDTYLAARNAAFAEGGALLAQVIEMLTRITTPAPVRYRQLDGYYLLRRGDYVLVLGALSTALERLRDAEKDSPRTFDLGRAGAACQGIGIPPIPRR